MSTIGGPEIITDGLVLSLDAANKKSYPGSGTAWADLSGNSNNGTLTNGPIFDSGNGGSIVFDGINDYVITQNLGLITTGTNDMFSVGVWLKTSSTVNYNKIIQLKDGVGLFLCADGGFGVQSNGDNSGICAAGTFIRDGSWHYIVGTYEESVKYTGFKDGVQVFDVATADGETVSTTDTYIGTQSTLGGTTFFNGSIAYIHVYNKILTPSEVLQNYTATKGRFGL